MPTGSSDWVIISGANGSLGRAIVDHFAALDRPILALDRSVELIETVNRPSIHARAVDLTAEADVKALLDEVIPRSDRLCLLVNAVGLIWNEPVLKLRGANLQVHSLENWRRVIEANLTAPFAMASLVAARMARKGGGAIINFSSIASRGNVGQAAYSAAKAGIEGLTRTMAAELGPVGIRVNAIAPGFFDVPSTRAAMSDEQLKALADQTPVRRLGQTGELIDAIDFLAGNDFVNGVVLDVTGGLKL
ncbi:MAG TPA: SDR family oxidoreductase [Terriglobia bacterium]|nr:SDR family oxidoreductase [Terriglobia bacterium]